jgi:F-box domain
MANLPLEIQEQILSLLPFVDLLPLRRVSRLWDLIIFNLLSRVKHRSYLNSWTMTLSTSSGKTLSIPLNLESTRNAKDWSGIYRRPYIFSGAISGIYQADRPQVLKFQFWDTKQGEYSSVINPDCQYRCCGLCDITFWPWTTLPISRQGPLGEVITWRDLYIIDLWESNLDEALLEQKRIEQHIGATWYNAPPIIPANQGYVGIYIGTPVQMTEDGYVDVQGVPGNSFAPNRIRIALSYSAICGFLVLQRRKEEFNAGKICFDPVRAAVQDPIMKELGIQATIGCGCKLIDWEHEDLGIKVIRLEDSESNGYNRFR